MTTIEMTGYLDRIAWRLWEHHSERLQGADDSALRQFVDTQLQPLGPTAEEQQGVVDRLQQMQRDSAAPVDTRPPSDDPFERLYR